MHRKKAHRSHLYCLPLLAPSKTQKAVFDSIVCTQNYLSLLYHIFTFFLADFVAQKELIIPIHRLLLFVSFSRTHMSLPLLPMSA